MAKSNLLPSRIFYFLIMSKADKIANALAEKIENCGAILCFFDTV